MQTSSPPPDAWRRWCPGAWRAWLTRPMVLPAERQQARELLQQTPLLDTRPCMGEAWFPSVGAHIPGLQGLLLCVRAGPPGACDGRLPMAPDADLTHAVHGWVAGLVGVPSPELLGLPPLFTTVPPPGFTASGPSAQLAGAVALISHLLGAPPRAPALCTGQLTQPGWVGAVGGLGEKRAVLALEAPGLPAVLVEVEADADLLLQGWFGPDWRPSLEQATRLSPQALVTDAWRRYEARDYRQAELKAAEAVRIGLGHTRARAALLVGACRVHRNEAGEGLALMNAAEEALRGPPAPGDAPLDAYVVQELQAFAGIALLDRWDVRRARDLLTRALQGMTETPLPWDKRTRFVVLQIAGSLHRVCVLDGDLGAAEQALRVWALDAAWLPEEEARAHSDLAEVLRRAGRLEEARAELTAAAAALPSALEGTRPFTRRFMNLYRARAGATPAWPVEAVRWQDWPQPAEVLETLLAGPPAALDAWVHEQILAPGAGNPEPLASYQVAAGAVARCVAVTGALLSCAPELVRRILALAPAIDPGVKAALEALAAGEPEAWVRRSPY
ncbi:MAG: S16 family serine protease [Pseudomonadota bacterium]